MGLFYHLVVEQRERCQYLGAGVHRWVSLGLPRLAGSPANEGHGRARHACHEAAYRFPLQNVSGHLSIATGLRPTGHGVVDNYFCRSDRPDCYNMGSGREDPTWLNGIPLWTLVEQQGGRASTFFWPESDARFADILPTDYRAFDGRISHRARVDQAIEWLELPDGERPDLVTLYFESVDSAGHRYGPMAPETSSAIAEVDQQIGSLWRAIESINARSNAGINLMLVSDHGMAEVDPDVFIDTNTLPRPKGFKRVNGSTRVTYYQRDPSANIEALAEALEADSGGRYWLVSEEVLSNRHFKDHPAVGDLIIETAPPRVFRWRGGKDADLFGMHGYPATLEDMAAFLVAVGPGFESGQDHTGGASAGRLPRCGGTAWLNAAR